MQVGPSYEIRISYMNLCLLTYTSRNRRSYQGWLKCPYIAWL